MDYLVYKILCLIIYKKLPLNFRSLAELRCLVIEINCCMQFYEFLLKTFLERGSDSFSGLEEGYTLLNFSLPLALLKSV